MSIPTEPVHDLAAASATDYTRRGASLTVSDFYRSWLSIRDLPMPTIPAINGHAIGAGLAVAFACGLR